MTSVGCCDDQDGGYQTIVYTFHYVHNNVTKTKTATNLSYVHFVDEVFGVGPAQSLTVKLFANNTYGNEVFYGNLTTKIDVLGKTDVIMGKSFCHSFSLYII